MAWIIILALGIATLTAIGLAIAYRFRLERLQRQYQQLLKEQSQYQE